MIYFFNMRCMLYKGNIFFYGKADLQMQLRIKF